MPLVRCKFYHSRCGARHNLRKSETKKLPHFLRFRAVWPKFSMRVNLIMPSKLLTDCKFCGKYRSESLALWEILNVFLSVLSTSVPKCGIRDLRRMLLRMCSFLANRRSKDNLGTVCTVSRRAPFTACVFHRPAEPRFGCTAHADIRQWTLCCGREHKMEIQKLLVKQHEHVEVFKYFGKRQLQIKITFLKIFGKLNSRVSCCKIISTFHFL
jgi:hypothetical protein